MQRLKSHRVHLYLLRPDGERGMFHSLGSAHGYLPSLWQVLLADATPRPELGRIVGDDSAQWIASDAQSAVLRYREFTKLIARHPSYEQVAGLDRYLLAAHEYLDESIAQWRVAKAAAPALCLDLARLPLDLVTGQAIDHLQQLQTFRRQLQSMMTAGDYDAIESLLRFPMRLLRFTDWRAWSGMFGLAQFEPHYFSAAFRQPFPEPFVDHDYDEFGSEDKLGEHRYRLRHGAYWGLASDREGRGDFILAPEWDRILRTGHGDSAAAELVWVQRNGRHALASIHDGRLLCDLMLDEVHGFQHDVAIVARNARYGLLDITGSWRLAPCLDEIQPFANGLAVVRGGGRFGYIDTHGATAIAMQFESADDFNTAGIARVSLNGRCGLVRRDGQMALPLEFERIEWSTDFGGWLCERDGTVSLAHDNGQIWSAADWTAMEVLVPDHWIKVQHGANMGLLDWHGAVLLPAEFESLTLRSFSSAIPASVQIGRSRRWALQKITSALQSAPAIQGRELVARRDGRLGLFDEQLRLVVPFEFSRIEALEPHVEGQLRLHEPDLVRVMSMPGEAAPRVGVWSIAQQRYIVPCAFDYVWLCLFDGNGRYGFVVGNRNPKRGFSTQGRYRVGLLRADGSVLAPQRYAWIAESTPLNRDDAMLDIRSTLFYYWSRGEAVRAAINDKGPQVSLDVQGLEPVALI